MFQGKLSHDPLSEIWNFIECRKEANRTHAESIISRIKSDIGITINHVELVSCEVAEAQKIYYYCGQLTDRNVNEIRRREYQLVNFFSMKEVDELILGTSAHSFWQKHKNFSVDSMLQQ